MSAIFAYLDESGCLGFDFSKPGTSPYFVITLLLCHSSAAKKGFSQSVHKTLKNKINHKRAKPKDELKGSSLTLAQKEYFLRHSPETDWEIYSVILNKQRVVSALTTSTGKKKLYNFLAKFLLEKIRFPESPTTVNLILDKCKDGDDIEDFNCYLATYLETQLPVSTPLYISHENSQNNPGIQAVDLFCWGINRKHTFGDGSWYDCFKSRIAYEEVYLPKKERATPFESISSSSYPTDGREHQRHIKGLTRPSSE